MKRYIGEIIICGIFFLLGLLLAGCTRDVPAYEQSTQNALDTINAIEQGLPAECKTDTNTLLFNVSRKETARIKTDCDEAVAKVQKEKLRWKFSFWALVLVIGAYIARKVLK